MESWRDKLMEMDSADHVKLIEQLVKQTKHDTRRAAYLTAVKRIKSLFKDAVIEELEELYHSKKWRMHPVGIRDDILDRINELKGSNPSTSPRSE